MSENFIRRFSLANITKNLYPAFIDEYMIVPRSFIVSAFIVQILANTKIITPNKGYHRRFVDDPEVTFDGNWNFLRFFCDAKRRGRVARRGASERGNDVF